MKWESTPAAAQSQLPNAASAEDRQDTLLFVGALPSFAVHGVASLLHPYVSALRLRVSGGPRAASGVLPPCVAQRLLLLAVLCHVHLLARPRYQVRCHADTSGV